jgi:hypothetical protein
MANELEEKIAALEAENNDLKGIVADMQEKLEEAGATAAKAPQVKVATLNKVKYEVTSGAYVPVLGAFSIDELAKNKEAMAAVLGIEGQTILKPL